MKLRTWCIRSGQILAKPALVFAGFLVFLTFFNAVTVQAENGRGGITIRQENVSIQKVFQSIEKQSGYRFFYNETLLQGAVKVTLDLQNASLQEALDACFRNQPLSYAIVDKTIIVKRRSGQQPVAPGPVAVSFTKPNKGKIIAVRGKVTSNNIPVAGASIMIKGTDNGASTDQDGIFTLAEVDEDAILVVSSVSHEAKEVKVNGQGFITIDLAKRADDLDETVVVAYNTTTRRMNTGAVTVVKGEEIQSLPNRSVDKSLQGLVPGLLVTSGTGQPGGGLSNFVLRGIATGQDPGGAGSTVRNPLIVMDGIPVSQESSQWAFTATETPVINPLAQLNPSDIESVTVLKDAAAIALYGSKASNGVILITTKKGKAGKSVISFRHQTDIAQRLKGKVELLNQQEYLDVLYQTFANSGFTNKDSIQSDLYKKFPVQIHDGDTSFYPATNWENELYSNHAATISNEISISGGNDKTNYFLNLEYTKQNGVYKKTGYDRKSVRLNFENRPTNWLKLGINTTMSYNIQDYAALYGDFPLGITSFNMPLNPVRLENGDYLLNFNYPYPTFIANPVAANEYNTNRNTSFRGLSKLYAELTLFKYFKFASTLGVDFMLIEAKEVFDPRLYDPIISSVGKGRLQQRDTRNSNLISNNILRFDRVINRDHSVNIQLGQEAQILYNKYTQVTATSLKYPGYDQIGGYSTQASSGLTGKQTLASYFGQINYGYKNKYLFSSSIRKDGSSKFGERSRFGTYWSTGVGWVMTEEPFLKSASQWLNYLKIRGSFGAAGNSFAIDRYTRYDVLNTGYYLGNAAVYPNASNPGNPDIKWEQTFSWDAGIEGRFLKERIILTADVYKRKTSDLIYSINLPYSSGYTSVLENIGDINNKGVELSISVDVIKNRNITWNVNANWSSNKNILVKANVPLTAVSGTKLANEVGRNFNSFYLHPWAGVNPADGSPMWLDSTGKSNTVYAASKSEFVGKPQPDGFGAITHSFSYKNFQLSALFYYQYGFQVYYQSVLNNDGNYVFMNQSKDALNAWKKPGDLAPNPKRLLNNSNAQRASTRFLYDGDFIRLQTLSFGYHFPRKVAANLGLSSLKVYAQAYNLGVWTKFSGGDISSINSAGSVGLSYPNQKTYSIGINASF